MITENHLDPLLISLGFEKRASIYRRIFGEAVVEVDSKKREIRYPEAAGLIINERQTCNFEAHENFVVLECVCRLLAKGCNDPLKTCTGVIVKGKTDEHRYGRRD
jgi:hypothetical protein